MKDKYDKVFTEVFDVNAEKLGDTFTSENIENWDSVVQLNLISGLEDEFDVMLDTEEIINLNSYLKGIEILKKHGVKF